MLAVEPRRKSGRAWSATLFKPKQVLAFRIKSEVRPASLRPYTVDLVGPALEYIPPDSANVLDLAEFQPVPTEFRPVQSLHRLTDRPGRPRRIGSRRYLLGCSEVSGSSQRRDETHPCSRGHRKGGRVFSAFLGGAESKLLRQIQRIQTQKLQECAGYMENAPCTAALLDFA